MTRLRIFCSRKKTTPSNSIEITHVGGVNASGERWNISVKDAIQRIQSGENSFFIVEDLQELTIDISAKNDSSLFVTAPGYLHNFLEDLVDCP